MDIKKEVLICGASITGPVLAYWLDKEKFEITLLEKEKALPRGGQNIDIKGVARQVIRMMGLEDEIKSRFTNELGLQFLDANGRVEAAFPRDAQTSFTQELEILRGDLAEIFFNAIKDDVKPVFGNYVSRLDQKDDKVEITLDNGERNRFDLVLACDGIGSNTRALILGSRDVFKYLGVYTSYFTITRTASDNDWGRWYNAPGGKVILLRPDNKGTIKVCVNFWSEEMFDRNLPPQKQKDIVKSVLRGAGWECDRIAAEIDNTADFYFGSLSQIKIPTWSKGNCAMAGDAAYAPSLLSGMGTSLAIIGAYILAGELNTNNDIATAFKAYEGKLRAYVEDIQRLPPGVPRLAYPKTRTGIWLLNKTAGFVASKAVQKTVGLFTKSGEEKDNEFELPVYQ